MACETLFSPLWERWKMGKIDFVYFLSIYFEHFVLRCCFKNSFPHQRATQRRREAVCDRDLHRGRGACSGQVQHHYLQTFFLFFVSKRSASILPFKVRHPPRPGGGRLVWRAPPGDGDWGQRVPQAITQAGEEGGAGRHNNHCHKSGSEVREGMKKVT